MGFYGSPPDHWAIATISEIAEINPKLEKAYIPDDLEVSFVPMTAVEAETGHIELSAARRFGEVKRGYTRFQEHDVLFAKITPCMENGKIAIVPALQNGLGFGSTEFHVLRPRTGILTSYLYYYLSTRHFRNAAEANMTGAVGQRRVPASYLSTQTIPIPPTTEQQRIVQRLETLFSELDKSIESFKTAREQLKVYRQAVLNNAFEGKLTALWRKGKGPLAWEKTKLGCLLSCLTSGSRGWAKYYATQGDLFIRAQNLKHDRLDLDEIAFVTPPETSEGVRTRVQVGDVLITITGANVTKTGYVYADLGKAYVSQHVALCRPDRKLDAEFLYLYLIAECRGRRQLTKLAYGAGKPGLNLDNIRSVEILLPPLDEQKEIVKKTNEMLSLAENFASTIEAEIKRVEVLRQSILKKAFSGQLVPQDPTDEPASVLLDRIRAENSSQPEPSRRNTKRHPRGIQAGPA